jgi:signal transduction histidine kinase
VTFTVLRSYDAATQFLRNVNRLLLGVGLLAVLAGAGLMFMISHRFTRPLAALSSGVAALRRGDFAYPLKSESHDELGDLTTAFNEMRNTLKENQQQLVQAERLATIGRMAGSISHDLRHPLTTILAYAELLSDPHIDEAERNELYREIRASVDNMTESIHSLLEFSRAQEALRLVWGDVADTLRNAIRAARIRPDFQHVQMTFDREGATKGWFDFHRLDRAFQNLLQNACEAAPPGAGRIGVTARGMADAVEIRVTDNGMGIPEEIRADVFQPFVTHGKAAGTGLGLAIAQKVIRDHGGDIAVESSGPDGTTFRVRLPLTPRTS